MSSWSVGCVPVHRLFGAHAVPYSCSSAVASGPGRSRRSAQALPVSASDCSPESFGMIVKQHMNYALRLLSKASTHCSVSELGITAARCKAAFLSVSENVERFIRAYLSILPVLIQDLLPFTTLLVTARLTNVGTWFLHRAGLLLNQPA